MRLTMVQVKTRQAAVSRVNDRVDYYDARVCVSCPEPQSREVNYR